LFLRTLVCNVNENLPRSLLQERVEKLSRTKVELERTAEDLRRQLEILQHAVRQHASAGCNLSRATSASSAFH